MGVKGCCTQINIFDRLLYENNILESKIVNAFNKSILSNSIFHILNSAIILLFFMEMWVRYGTFPKN